MSDWPEQRSATCPNEGSSLQSVLRWLSDLPACRRFRGVLEGTVLHFDDTATGCLALTSRSDEGWLIRDSTIAGVKHYRIVKGHPDQILLRGAGVSTIHLKSDGTFSTSNYDGTLHTGHWEAGEHC